MGNIVFLSVIILIFSFIFWKGYQENRKRNKQIEKELQLQWKERREKIFSPYEMDKISYLAKKEKNENYVDELTWNDLEMDKIYEKICYCSSTLGEEYLYHMLRNPLRQWEKLRELEKKISCFSGDEDTILLQREFVRLGRIKKYSMVQYLDYLMKLEKKSNLSHYLALLVLASSLGFMYLHLMSGLLLFFTIVLFQIIRYFKIKAQMAPYLISLRYLFKIVDAMELMLPFFPKEWKEEEKRLKEIYLKLKKTRKNSFWVLSYGSMAGQGLELILDYVRMIFHVDLIKFNGILKTVKSTETDLYYLYKTMGKMDACISIAQYRNNLKYWTSPKENCIGQIEITEGYHPLLADPVTNDLTLSKSLLLTGSNASGKSTFLKMIGVNLLLSQGIHTAAAKYFSFPYCRLFTCLSVKDSLLLSESYYVAEIKALKRIFDAVSEKEKIVCMVDEILRGTNTMERIAASTEILKEMRKRGIIILAATHDRELTKTLEEEFENYHFQEAISGEDLCFTYKILSGRADTTNAISLLSYMGYDSELIRRARKRLEKFQKEGEWE